MGAHLENKKIDSVRKIIKYNPYRRYVGIWSPNQIQLKFSEIRDNPFRPLFPVYIGGLSADMVCDAVWNEMSYNPLHFGTQSPFTKNDVASIQSFCKTYKTNEPESDIMSKIATELWFFLHFINKSNPEFIENGKIKGENILIQLDRDQKPNSGYRALACLVHTMHAIATQNLRDYNKREFREQINTVVISRHPNLQRSRRYPNYTSNQKLADHKNDLYAQIMRTAEEIANTDSMIQTLSEYEPPVDTTEQQNLLSRQQAYLQKLDELYAPVQQLYDEMIAAQNTKEI